MDQTQDESPTVVSLPVHQYGFETDEARDFPGYLIYETVNVCNAQCSHCPQSEIAARAGFTPRRLSMETFKRTIEEAAGYRVDVVRFTGEGEPLLHPQLADMIGYTRDLGFPTVNLTTNGSILHKGDQLDRLLENPPHVFDVSLDAFEPETFARVRVGLDFEQTKRNVLTLLQRRDPSRSMVLVSMVVTPGTEAEAERFERYWERLVDKVVIRQMHSNLNSTMMSVELAETVQSVHRWPCRHLWERLVVDFRDHIRFCPVDWEDASTIGSVHEMTLHEAWHSEFMQDLRRRHLQSNYRGCGVCEKCPDWAASPWDQGWLKMIRALRQHVG